MVEKAEREHVMSRDHAKTSCSVGKRLKGFKGHFSMIVFRHRLPERRLNRTNLCNSRISGTGGDVPENLRSNSGLNQDRLFTIGGHLRRGLDT